jgi:hypothetical protein
MTERASVGGSRALFGVDRSRAVGVAEYRGALLGDGHENGYTVADRGRMPAEVVTPYHNAQPA